MDQDSKLGKIVSEDRKVRGEVRVVGHCSVFQQLYTLWFYQHTKHEKSSEERWSFIVTEGSGFRETRAEIFFTAMKFLLCIILWIMENTEVLYEW